MGHDGRVTGSALEQLPIILAVCEGPDLRLVACSDATRTLLTGRDPIGKPMREVISDLSGQQFTDAYYEVYRTGEAIAGQEWRAHLDMPDGSVHEMWATFTISPWRHPDGSIRGVIGAGFDVTASVLARQAAEERATGLQQRYQQTRDVITALQRELLPAGLPMLPGLQVAASYLLADADTAAGGDWYDAVVRPDGTVALIVGDVVGHGVTASGVMGQLRAVLRDRLDAGADIAEALAAADRFARRLPAAHATTVCLVLLDPADGTFEYCTAGHPPPLVIEISGGTHHLPGTGGTPLGTSGSFPVREGTLAPGDLVLIYSDGILERPGRSLPKSAAELAHVAADSAAGRALHDPDATAAERVCTQTVELLVRATGHTDDITLLAAQRVTPPDELDLTLAAEPGSLRRFRAAIAGWLAGLGATERDVFALQHAFGELLTNAVEHAFDTGARPHRPVVRLQAALRPDGCIDATITDQGRWREPAGRTARGRGLALTAHLVASVRVDPTPAGTVAVVRHPLTRPARMASGDLPAGGGLATGARSAGRRRPESPAEPATDFRVGDAGDDGRRVRVQGPVDVTTADRLQYELLQRGRGGTLPLTVDLTAVTHLASAGVSALYLVAEKHREQGGRLAVAAEPGSPARDVLALVPIPDVPVIPAVDGAG
jgi:serine phosphatase RsbU (regulator of sigma subunit)/anti-sigma regulatory factor (Ser/Thr protein kinase)/anti-anti-sigma regulatory factor